MIVYIKLHNNYIMNSSKAVKAVNSGNAKVMVLGPCIPWTNQKNFKAKKKLDDANILLSLKTMPVPPATQTQPRTHMYPLGIRIFPGDLYIVLYSKNTGNTTLVVLNSDPDKFRNFTSNFCSIMDQKCLPRKKFMRAVGCMAIRKFPEENGSNFVQNLKTLKSFEI